MSECITYEAFSAVGDGVTDDMPAIVRAHNEANRLGLPVRARTGATYYISPKAATATVCTSVDWTGAAFIMDDRHCENIHAPIFHVTQDEAPVELTVSSAVRGQTQLNNPTGRDLHLILTNHDHLDYIRYGLNQNNGTPRTDNVIVYADGHLSSPISFDFECVTAISANPIPQQRLTLTGGTFTTIANIAESKYNYHGRNICIDRSHVEVCELTHLIEGEQDHGAPYAGFLSINSCARVEVHDCLFTAHYIYQTIGSAGKPVSMGSYDISCNSACEITFRHCRQTTDIMDKRYWGLIGTNFCRDLLFEDCRFSRFDAHMGVSNCTLRRCTLGWQCLNAIGHGTFLIEDTAAYGYAFVTLREDYGSTWRGDILIRNCTWHPLSARRSVFFAHNDGHHDFGYDCYLPNVDIDGLTVTEEGEIDDRPLYVFNDHIGDNPKGPQIYLPAPPEKVKIKNIRTPRRILLCPKPEYMTHTVYEEN